MEIRTKNELHRLRHVQLHTALDELIADFARHNAGKNAGKLYSNTTIEELMKWSHQQTIEPELDNQ